MLPASLVDVALLYSMGSSGGGSVAPSLIGACPCLNLSKTCRGLRGKRPAPCDVRALIGAGRKLPLFTATMRLTATMPNKTRQSTCTPFAVWSGGNNPMSSQWLKKMRRVS